jgi:hypothetical protein
MPRIYRAKKDVSVRKLGPAPDGNLVRDAWRLYTFSLAEELFPERFEELREHPHAIASWVRSLNLVRYPDSLPDWALPKCDLWLRQLAHDWLRARHEGEQPISNTIVGGVPKSAAPQGNDETPEAFKKRIVRAKVTLGRGRNVPGWHHMSHFKCHFEWFLRYRIERYTYEKLAEHVGANTSTVKRAVKTVAALIGEPEL